MKLSDIGEFGLLDIIKKEVPAYPPDVVKGIGDDTAVLKVNGSKLQLMTTDMLVEGVHFSLAYALPWQVGVKALNVNVSDIIAMGGKPTNATVAIGIPKDMDSEIVQGIYRGIADMATRYNISIVGGDTVSAPVTVINITLLGEVEESQVIYRSGAKPGDIIFVTGPLGGSTAGLFHFKHPDLLTLEDVAREAANMHLLPMPRVEESKLLVSTGIVTAMNDISDGLASELFEICQASGVGCQIYAEKIPVSKPAKTIAWSTGHNALEWALYGGEDYQLVFTVPQDKALQLARFMKARGKPLVYIGDITPQSMYVIDAKGSKLPFSAMGYDHFSKSSE